MECVASRPTQGLQSISCIFCGTGAPSEVVIKENGFQGNQCQECGLIFVSPRPNLQDIIDLYGHDEAHVPAGAHLSAGYAKRLYARHALRIVRKHKASGAILEIGAGAGLFLDEARDQGFEPFAIEFNGIQVNHIREVLRIPCASVPLSEDPFHGKSFDVIYHCDVVSHFHDPIADFRSFHDALLPGGLMVFETGNIGDIDRRYYRLFERFQYPDHLFFFSRKNISSLLEASGFELLEVHRYSILPDLIVGRLRNRARRFLRKVMGTRGSKGAPAQGMAPTNGAPSRDPLSLAKAVDQYLNYQLRYSVGKLAPKRRRPQTMIVVARRA